MIQWDVGELEFVREIVATITDHLDELVLPGVGYRPDRALSKPADPPARQPARRFGALVCPLDVIEDGLKGGGLPEWILI